MQASRRVLPYERQRVAERCHVGAWLHGMAGQMPPKGTSPGQALE
jgi:hypothetical protein